MSNSLLDTAQELVTVVNQIKDMKNLVDNTIGKINEKDLGKELARFIKKRALQYSIIGIIPFIGGIFLTLIAGYLLWSMYFAINKKIGINFQKSKIKAIMAGAGTNIIMCYVGMIIFSFIPITTILVAIFYYASVMISAKLYLLLLTKYLKTEYNL